MRAKRLVYLAHRWTGVAGCLLMVLWFASGVVMLFVGYPKLTPWERLGALPALPAVNCCAPPDGVVDEWHAAQVGLVLTTIAGRPQFVLQDGGRPSAVPPGGAREGPITLAQALAEAQAFAPGAPLHHAGMVYEDRWTHARSLDLHRPLHRIAVGGNRPGDLYVSSATGQIVLDAPRVQQYWNYAGAWLHWLYPLRDRSVDPRWSWIVIALSAACTVTAASGLLVGVWRWRFRGRYKSGARTPYRQAWMRWHHLFGLGFGIVVCTWIFSGLMSMNPLEIFAPASRPDIAAYRDGVRPATPLQRGWLASPGQILHALRSDGFAAVELQWKTLGGRPYAIAYDAQADSRVVRIASAARVSVSPFWSPDDVMPAASRLLAWPVAQSRVLHAHDAYYYRRHAEAMNGALPRSLPALRVDFADPARTRIYIDLRTGEVAASLDRSQRLGRWLFYFLHSWDLPALLRAGRARDVAIIALSLGGLVVSVSGVVIGWRRLGKPWPTRNRKSQS